VKIEGLCKIFDISRQGYYKGKKAKVKASLNEEIIIDLVREKRKRMPRIGGVKLYKLLKSDLNISGIRIGRDKFFEILRKHRMLVKRKKRYAKTTDSNHRFKIYKNLIKEKEEINPDEVYVSDITYIRTEENFCYLSLITDYSSRKIVGYDLSDSLSIEGSLRAIRMALKGKGEMPGLIHHSDRGIQYCSKQYTELLTKHKISISMSEKGNPYENAIAERVNGILKDEFLLSETFKNKEEAMKAVKEAIKTYNELRPHMSINYKTPDEKYAA
jgi:transposase InsO family protein